MLLYHKFTLHKAQSNWISRKGIFLLQAFLGGIYYLTIHLLDYQNLATYFGFICPCLIHSNEHINTRKHVSQHTRF